jgi:signal transduction histidine kinase
VRVDIFGWCHGAQAPQKGRASVDGSGYFRAPTDELSERDHELRASLCGIEAVALALNEQRDRLPYGEVDRLVLAIASEARRLQVMLAPQVTQLAIFDLAEAIRPAILMTRSLGVVVHDEVPPGMLVLGRRDEVAQVVLALLDNARVHAAASAVDVRARSRDGMTTLYVEDRGPGITRATVRTMFERGCRGAQSSGSGLGLSIARSLMLDQAGSLTVNRRPGGGASFALSLPSSSMDSSRRLARVARHPAVAR